MTNADLPQHSPEALIRALESYLKAEKKRPHFCDRCGANASADDIIDRDGFLLDPRGPITYQDKPLKLTRVQRCILITLAHGRDTRISANALAERCCYLRNHGKVNPISVHLSTLRDRLKANGAPVPFLCDREIGYYWSLGS